MLTTTIGAYPKPDYVPIRDWFQGQEEGFAPTAGYAETVAAHGDLEAVLDRATAEVVEEQVALGIDIPTDGEIRRENYIHYHCRHLDGIDFDQLTEKTIRGVRSMRLPTITGRIRARDSFLVRDWRVAQRATSRPVKMTIPGPMTIADTLADAHYDGDVHARGVDLAQAINQEARMLAAAGCRHVQIDEPLFARRPDDALAYGIDHLERCFRGLPDGVTRVVHICCGYPDRLDHEDYAKAPQESYFQLAEALDQAAVDAVSIEDAHRPNDLRLLERFRRTTVILGVIAIARSRVEEVEAVRARLRAALGHIERERLMAAPDCGLGFLGRDLARAKLRVLVEAARGL